MKKYTLKPLYVRMLKFIKPINPKYFSSRACIVCKNYNYEKNKCELFDHITMNGSDILNEKKINNVCGVNNPFFDKAALDTLKTRNESGKGVYILSFRGFVASQSFSWFIMFCAASNPKLWGLSFFALGLQAISVSFCEINIVVSKNIDVIEEQIETNEEFNNSKN